MPLGRKRLAPRYFLRQASHAGSSRELEVLWSFFPSRSNTLFVAQATSSEVYHYLNPQSRRTIKLVASKHSMLCETRHRNCACLYLRCLDPWKLRQSEGAEIGWTAIAANCGQTRGAGRPRSRTETGDWRRRLGALCGLQNYSKNTLPVKPAPR